MIAKNVEDRPKFVPGTYKTELCTQFQHGTCEFGKKCQFAHGIEDLRPRDYGNKKYKTQLCRNYTKNGFCPFGTRCRFIHDEQRIQVSPSTQWLVSASENLVRVEVDEDDLKQNNPRKPIYSSQFQYPPSSQIFFTPSEMVSTLPKNMNLYHYPPYFPMNLEYTPNQMYIKKSNPTSSIFPKAEG